MRRMTLRAKLTLTHAAVALVVLALVTLAFDRAVVVGFERLATAQSARTAGRIARPLVALYRRHGSWQAVRRELVASDRSLLDTGAQRVLVADQRGVIVIDTLGRLEGRQFSAGQRRVAAPVIRNNVTVGYVTVAVTTGRWGALEDRYVRGVSRLLLVASLGAAGCAIVIASLLARGMTRPLQALTAATRQLTLPEGSRWTKPPAALPVTAHDEVGELTAAFNLMVAELSRQETLRRRMVGDIAHELRTPLSVLKIELEALEDGVVAPAPAAFVSLKEEVDLLGRLVDDLQLLSLAEAGQLSLVMVSLEPAPALARSAARAAGRAKQRRIDIHVEASPGLSPIHADEQRLAQALDNLIENALRYTPPGGHITLACRTGDGEIHFVVRDTGPGIPTADLERIFDHFYRTDRARARHTGGTGLGLAIVRSLMAAMGGRVYVESPSNHGATFVLALPARNSPSDNGRAMIA